MRELAVVAFASWLAGIAAFVGALFANFEGSAESETKREIIHGIVAFGGGILIAAVAFALAPEGIAALSPPVLAVTFCFGGVAFAAVDAYIASRGGSKSQFLAMLLDFIPEAMVFGAIFGEPNGSGVLLALFIGAQNLPEGFNAHRENVAAGVSTRTSLLSLAGVSLLGPLAACGGYLFLRGHQTLTAGIMSIAAGGILYLVFQDIAPQSKMQRHWTPPLGAVLGFVVGMVGEQVFG